MVSCDNCEYDNKETAKFCRSCGIKIEITEPVPAPKSSRLFKIGKKSRQQELEEYEEQYLRRQGQRPRRKPADTIGIVEEFARKRPRLTETSSSCDSCGKPLKPTAKFCGKCGAKQ